MERKENLGPFIKRLREQRGVSLAEMGDETGLSGSYINRLENKSRLNPSLESISRIVKFFNIPFSTIEEFCDCGNVNETKVKKFNYILLSERYSFANIEVDNNFKMLLSELIKELEEYCTKALISRQIQLLYQES